MAETWWIQPSREAFAQAAQAQAERLRRDGDRGPKSEILGSWTDVRISQEQHVARDYPKAER